MSGHMTGDARKRLDESIADAEQRGREDNAAHDMCYVHGSKALDALLEQARADERERIATLLDGHGLVRAIHDPLCPERTTHGSSDKPCRFPDEATAYDLAESVKTYLAIARSHATNEAES